MAKASKKTAVKPVKETIIENQDTNTTKENNFTPSPTRVSPKMGTLLVIGILVLVVGFLIAKNFLVVAWVGNKPILMTEYIKEMEVQVGKKTLENIIIKSLVENEAKKQNLTIAQTEIDQEIDGIKSKFEGKEYTLEEALAADGMSLSMLTDQIKMQKMVEKLAPDPIAIKEEDIKAFLEQNKSLLPKTVSQEELNKLATDTLTNRSKQEQINAWIEGLKTSAQITYWR